MAKCDYCQNVLLVTPCKEYQENKCDHCNVYMAYQEGVYKCACEIWKRLKAKEQENDN